MENLRIKATYYSGGQCKKCGYKKCLRALHFHHIDPSTKEYAIFEGRPGQKKVRNWEKLKLEIDKCILLCANCHMELHDMDEKVFHEVIQIKLNRQDIEYLNKSIRKNIINPDEALNKAIEIILNRHPKLNYRELRHQEWLQNNKIPEKYMSEL